MIFLLVWLVLCLCGLAWWVRLQVRLDRQANERIAREYRMLLLCENRIVVGGGPTGVALAKADAMLRSGVRDAKDWDSVVPEARA